MYLGSKWPPLMHYELTPVPPSYPAHPRKNSAGAGCFFKMVVPPGFEPGSPAPKAGMIDRYTTGLNGCKGGFCTPISILVP